MGSHLTLGMYVPDITMELIDMPVHFLPRFLNCAFRLTVLVERRLREHL